MARMSYEEKQERQEARYYGKRCRLHIGHAIFHGREAAQWRAVDGHDGTLTRMWQERADEHAKDAIEYARKAAHHAGLALAAAAGEEAQ